MVVVVDCCDVERGLRALLYGVACGLGMDAEAADGCEEVATSGDLAVGGVGYTGFDCLVLVSLVLRRIELCRHRDG